MTPEPDPRSLHKDALSCAAMGDLRRAIALLQDALSVDHGPQPALRADLAALHATRKEWSAAVEVIEPVVDVVAPTGVAVYLLASVATGTATDALARLAAIDPARWAGHADALAEYGRACLHAGRYAEAERALTSCLAEHAAMGRARHALAQTYFETGRGDLASVQWRRLGTAPGSTGRHRVDAAIGLLKCGLVDEAGEMRRRAEEDQLSGDALASALYLHLFDQDATAEEVRDLSVHHGRAPAIRCGPRRTSRDHRLRIGFLSGEFTSRPATYFLDPLLQGFDRERCLIVRYNTLPEYEKRPPAAHPHDVWRTLSALDQEAADVIGDDDLDVLIDLSGCFPGQRRDVLVRGPAPVQAAYPNYPGTTGIDAVQWFLTDRWLSPPGTEGGYSEQLFRLPGGALRYQPPMTLPVARRDEGGRALTFGFFQRAIKCSRATVDMVATVLHAVPTSRLLVHSADADLDVAESALRRRWIQWMSSRDVDSTRLTFAGPRRLEDHLGIVGSVDIALDAFPFSGQTTAMECLWMGVPVISRLGSLHVSRVSGALMSQVGLGAYVSEDAPGYVARAARLAADRCGLRRIQFQLRDRVLDAGLTDGRRLAAEVEAACRSWAASSSTRPLKESAGTTSPA